MQDEGGAKGLNPALEKHWEKIVLGLVAVLAVVLIGSKLSGGGNPAAKNVDKAVADFKGKVDDLNPRIEPLKAVPEPKVAAPPSANRAPEWAVGIRTDHQIIFREGERIITSFLFPDVNLGAPVPNPDGVTISWTVPKLEKPQNPKPRDPVVVLPATFFYRIEKRKKGGAWELLEEKLKSDKESLKYVDGKAEPKTDYEYRVTLGSNDPQFTKANPTQLTNKVGGPVSVSTRGIWEFKFSNMISYPEADPPKPGQVYVMIRKYDREHGLVEWRKIQYEGDFLGVVKEGGAEDSMHRVPDKFGKMVAVDFKCGGKILKITTDVMVPYTYKACNPKFDKDGVPVCKGPEEVKAHYRVNQVKYTDEDGKELNEEQAAGPGKIADKLCPDHGGAPPPKELSPAERLAQREAEATKMLDEADTLWASEKSADKKKAQAIYRKLVDSYSDLPSVKPRKSEITDRANKKKLD